MGEVRVVPSGKVYRQIFDAEVQLVRTLGEARRKSQHHAVPLDSGRIPIVRHLDTSTGHVLSSRRRTWMEGLLNDGITENPVLHRNAVLSAIKPKEVVEQNNAVREVKGLPDVVVPAKIGSNIIHHLLANKQENHGATVKKLEEELAAISRELEKRFTEAAEHLLQEVEKSYQTVQELWSKTENITDSSAIIFENLQEVWEAIVNQSLHRRKLINELDKTYKDFEKERVKKITAAFKDCLEALEKIAYIPLGDIHRFIDKEAMLINQALLANQRAMNKLYVNLMEADLIHEMSERQKRNLKVHELNIRKKNDILQNFKDFLANDWNAGLENEKYLLMQEQQNLNYKRIQRLEGIVNMNPFDLNKATLLQWYDSVRALNQEIDSLHIQYTSKLQVYHEKVYHVWMTEIDKSEEMLVNSGACTREEAKKLIVSDFLPIIGNLQRAFENEQYNVDKHMEILDQQMELQCNWIYSVIKEATELWEVHQEILADQEQQLKDRIDNCRKKHDKSNQTREANLDMLIDQLRQRNSEGELKSDLKKVKCLLDGIKRGYEGFYQRQMKIVNDYPSTSEKELLRFSTAISKCFDVIEIYKPNKPKIIIDAPTEVASPDEVAVTQSEMSEDIHGDILDESERNESMREEASDLSVTPNSEEGAELSGQETSSHIQGISIESIPKQDETEESRNTSDWSEQELSLYTSQHLSEEASEEKMGSISPKEQSGALEETDHGKMSTKFEYFKTSKGNIYTVMLDKKGRSSMNVISFLAETEEQKHLQDYMKHAFLPEATFLDLKKKMRLNFFELLEDWYDKAMNNAKNIAVIKKKEFKAELELRKHLHEPREKRIKMDVFNVRAVELRLHRDRVERHCRGVDEVLTKLKKDFRALQSEHCKSIVEFRNNIHNLEEIFKTANKSERLINLQNSLHNKQEKYMNSVNKLFRKFQNMLDKSLGKLQGDNAQFVTSFRYCKKFEFRQRAVIFSMVKGQIKIITKHLYLYSAIKYSKINRFDPRYQVFGETVEKSDQFKGSITFILWENTNALMAIAEEYYKKKDRHPVYRPEYLRDTFEQCADELIQRMLLYQAQADIYHSNCLQEFREQLKMFEELVSSVPPFLIEEVLKQHLDLITKTLAEKCSIFRKKLNQLENTKNENKRRLRPILGHPNNAEVLESLCKEEEERQNAEAAEINGNVKDQKNCMLEHAQNFVAILSSLSEQLLLEYDNFLIFDNILSAQPEATGETTRQKRPGPLLQEDENTSTIEMSRESRTWPGIPAYELSQICKHYNVWRTASTAPLFVETATVTTAKTVLADLAVLKSRDAAYVKYKQCFLQEMSQIERETEGLLINAQNWRDGWRGSVVNIMKLYALVRPPCIIPDPVF
ncbi:coiled-coil domain-containing protein 180-like [Rhincodon typus]|uniref:coiled-coil domain-containing protein 180-like n=1 Tax=Rhincodon typus TaxID=259920 RepID=UPI00202EB505|nr:coiled-coil domain-containing protein 180-like [Rhincodon typus]